MSTQFLINSGAISSIYFFKIRELKYCRIAISYCMTHKLISFKPEKRGHLYFGKVPGVLDKLNQGRADSKTLIRHLLRKWTRLPGRSRPIPGRLCLGPTTIGRIKDLQKRCLDYYYRRHVGQKDRPRPRSKSATRSWPRWSALLALILKSWFACQCWCWHRYHNLHYSFVPALCQGERKVYVSIHAYFSVADFRLRG